MIRHITYTNDLMTISAEKCRESALKSLCDMSTIYTEKDLTEEFRQENADILKQPRGCGYWIWKPQIILQEMEKSNPGDIILYTDAGIEIIHPIGNLIQELKGMMLFGSDNLHQEYCKGDYLYGSGKQIQATAMLFEVNSYNEAFVRIWKKWCTTSGAIDDSPSKELNHHNFKEHRHDQALLTSIAYIKSIPFYWWPAQYRIPTGTFNYPKSDLKGNYPIMFYHHRKRNEEW